MSLSLRRKSIIRSFFREYFDLKKDKDNELEAVDSIRKGVEFKGANLWILILAIFMASLGLNVNSTAVIIGAMLISPLMGPIMGIGLSVGLNDFELMKRSFKSYSLTTLFSITTATVYFLITPLSEAQSELLARTSPTIYDVFIALLGGLAGLIALSSKGKGNVIPGVAIATALMPPLCTAGFGFASGNIHYFLGAFYLYFINSVFISFGTYLGVRTMHFRQKEFVDKNREQFVRRSIVFVVLLTLLPAVYLTYGIVKSTLYEVAANRFISNELSFEKTQVLDRKVNYETNEIQVVLVGDKVDEEKIELARLKLADYQLESTKLSVFQGTNEDGIDLSSVRSMLMEDLYKNNEERLLAKQQRIGELEKQLERHQEYDNMSRTIVPELQVLYPTLSSLSISRAIEVESNTLKSDTMALAVLKFSKPLSEADKQRIGDWLKARTRVNKVKLVVSN